MTESQIKMALQDRCTSETTEGIASEFISKLEAQVPVFLKAVEAKLPFVKTYYADHVCWRTETMEDYQNLVTKLNDFPGSTLLIESFIGGRPIATFQLKQGIPCKGRQVTVLEIPAPKEGSPYVEGLEHVEFVICLDSNESQQSPTNNVTHQSMLQKIMEDHPELKWNEKAKSKDVNPDVSLKLDLPDFGKCSVKFHLMPLAKVIEYEIARGMT